MRAVRITGPGTKVWTIAEAMLPDRCQTDCFQHLRRSCFWPERLTNHAVGEDARPGAEWKSPPARKWQCGLQRCTGTNAGTAQPFESPDLRAVASIAQLAEHALRKRTVAGSIPAGALLYAMSDATCFYRQ